MASDALRYVWPPGNWSTPGLVFAVLSAIGILTSTTKGLGSVLGSLLVAVLFLGLINALYASGYHGTAWLVALAAPILAILLFLGMLVLIYEFIKNAGSKT